MDEMGTIIESKKSKDQIGISSAGIRKADIIAAITVKMFAINLSLKFNHLSLS